MENQNLLDRIFLYGVVGVVILIFATMFRYVSITAGSDDFTANVVFLIVSILGAALYSMIQLVIIEVLKLFSKKKVIGQGENKKVEKTVEKSEEESKDKAVGNVIGIGKDETENKNVVKSDDDELSKLFDKKYREKIRIEKQKLEIAIQYTKETFASYTSKEDLVKLCKYIEIYSRKGNFDKISPIEVNQLKYFDVYHFGWNIWNYFKTPNNSIRRIKMAEFLKHTFKELLKNVDVGGVKNHLKTDPKKGIIKIEEDITILTEHNQST